MRNPAKVVVLPIHAPFSLLLDSAADVPDDRELARSVLTNSFAVASSSTLQWETISDLAPV
jgi:hypothetical protein